MSKEERLNAAIEKAIDRCNLKGTDCDIYSVLYQYKAIRELSEEQIDEIYDRVAQALGFHW